MIMTKNNREISPTKPHIQFIEPIFTKQYTTVLHHDLLVNYHHGTLELMDYPYFRHYGLENTFDPNEHHKINYSNIKNLDPLYFLDAIHREQDGWHWLFKHIELPPPGMENKKRPIEDSDEDQSHKKQKITSSCPIIHACSSLCCVSFPHDTPKSKQFITPKWCGICATEYDIDKMFKIINSGGGNKTFLSYKLENQKWVLYDLKLTFNSHTN